MEKMIEQILNKENIKYNNFYRINGGFTNLAYSIDEKYILKIKQEYTKAEKIQNEIAFYKNVKSRFIPKYTTSGNIDGKDYLIIEKLKGETLYYVWHKLGNSERENAVKQIAKILKELHQQNYNYLPEKSINLDWVERWNKSFDLNINILKKKGFNTEPLEKFQALKLKEIFKENKVGLIYNDAHFDNFIYNNGEIKIIDFDRTRASSIDYELLIISLMLDNPRKFANEQCEKFVNLDDYKNVWQWLKKYYPSLFDFKYLSDRLFVYKFIYRLGEAYETQNNDMIQKGLKEFQEHFKL